MFVSKRRHLQNGALGIMILGAVVFAAASILSKYTTSVFVLDLFESLNIALCSVMGSLVIYFVICIVCSGGLKKYIEKEKIIRTVENNLISIGAYKKKENVSYVIVPKIRIKDDTIHISFNDIKIKERITKSLDSFSTALPEAYVVEDYYYMPSNNELVIEFERLKDYKQETYTFDEYNKLVSGMNAEEFYIDRKHKIDLKDYPHLLYTGGTGSGKSYAALQIVAQAILKDWEVTILDIKRSYGIYKEYIDYEVEAEAILNSLKAIENEMYERLDKLEPILDTNPSAMGTDCGYKSKLVLIEEYISLQSALEKKQRDELEKVIKNLSVLARQASIHIMIVMQSAGTENINASTRAQFTKMLLGNAQSNILNATFGNGVDIPQINNKRNKGEGLLQLERITIVRIPNIIDIECFRK